MRSIAQFSTHELLDWLCDEQYGGAGLSLGTHNVGWCNYISRDLDEQHARRAFWMRRLTPHQPQLDEKLELNLRRSLTGNWDTRAKKSNGHQQLKVHWIAIEGEELADDELDDRAPRSAALPVTQRGMPYRTEPPRRAFRPQAQAPAPAADSSAAIAAMFVGLAQAGMLNLGGAPAQSGTPLDSTSAHALLTQVLERLFQTHERTERWLKDVAMEGMRTNRALTMAMVQRSIAQSGTDPGVFAELMEVLDRNGAQLSTALDAVAGDEQLDPNMRNFANIVGVAVKVANAMQNSGQMPSDEPIDLEPDQGAEAPASSPSYSDYYAPSPA